MSPRSLALLLALAVPACAPRAPPAARPPAADGQAFVYGVLEVPAPLGVSACVVLIEADRERGAGGRHGCVPATADGLFWAEDVPPIRWVLDGVYAGGALHRLADGAPFAVAPGALHDLGVFRLEPGAGGARLVPATAPVRAEVLRRLLAQDGIAPRWKERIQAQLDAEQR